MENAMLYVHSCYLFYFCIERRDKCYWPTEVLYDSLWRDVDPAVMRGKPNTS